MKIFKTRIFAICLTIFTTLNAYSQGFSYGISIGTGLTNLHLDKNAISDKSGMFAPTISYNMNGILAYNFNALIGVSVEPGIARIGAKQLFANFDSQYQKINQQSIISFLFLQIPVLMNFRATEKLTISAGLEINHLISQNAKLTDKATTKNYLDNTYPLYASFPTGINSIADNIVPDKNYNFKTNSALLGAEYQINKRFAIAMRYCFGLKSLYYINWQDEYRTNQGGSEVFISNLQLALRTKL